MKWSIGLGTDRLGNEMQAGTERECVCVCACVLQHGIDGHIKRTVVAAHNPQAFRQSAAKSQKESPPSHYLIDHHPAFQNPRPGSPPRAICRVTSGIAARWEVSRNVPPSATDELRCRSRIDHIALVSFAARLPPPPRPPPRPRPPPPPRSRPRPRATSSKTSFSLKKPTSMANRFNPGPIFLSAVIAAVYFALNATASAWDSRTLALAALHWGDWGPWVAWAHSRARMALARV